MKLVHAVNDMSFRKKIMILFALIGIVPLIITFFVSYNEIRQLVVNGQDYAENQNYEQTLSTLAKKFSHLEELSAMIIVNKDMNTILSMKPDDMKIPEQMAAFNSMVAYTQMMETNSEFDHIVYFVDDKFIVTGTDTLFRKLSAVRNTDWGNKVYASNGASTWVIRQENNLDSTERYLALGRLLWNPRDYMDPAGIVTLNVDLKQIQQSLIKSDPLQFVYVESEDGELITSSGEQELAFMRLPKPIDSKGKFTTVQLDSGTYLARGQKIGDTNLYLMSVISHAAASDALLSIRNQMLTVYLVVCIILLVFIFPVARSITRRIFLLMNKMSQVRQGRLNQLDIEPRKDEVGQLISSYNYMINSVQELMQEQFKLGQEKNEAELRALQSQINPHFLYNTLDMINWMAQRDERDNIQQVVYALSDYYKLILNKGEDFVSLRDEVRLSEIYMEIQRKRFRNRIQLETELAEETLDCLIPKITLQPLVENAILHGITEKPGGVGVIKLRGSIELGRLHIAVEDDGIGFQASNGDNRKHRGSGYGVKNIEKRLALYYGQPTDLNFHTPEAGGTIVSFDVPIVRRERMDGGEG
ncbi:sensor histidine kinase YesM [Paenibacillus sp. CCS19]|uniref:cache domain-containing sensor histidine kinase n=1 Tax=Paenibacillus sp. CCS19 TaxID=3158387 RepID=UPI00255F63D7|nr:sensor histidine kinase [Paenibacillus cellulosilyticus]GMK39218.1 sensor histidine kinase YesM [Paenibacillus cellulosilyticus]